MQRRRLLAGLGALAGVGSLAGCTVTLPKPGEPELAHDVDTASFVGDGFQPTVLVTGSVTNVGSVYVDRARVTATLLDGSGESIDERSLDLERLEQEETQLLHYVFPISATDVASFESVDVSVEYPR